MILRKAWAFLKRDFQIQTSYAVEFLITAANSIFPIILFFFIGKLVSPTNTSIEQYGGDYFTFSIIGLAFIRFFQLALTAFSQSIQRAQVTGCLEAMFGSQTPPHTSVLLSALYSLIYSAIQLIVILLTSILVFNLNITQINLISTLVVFLMSLMIFIGFGLISAAGIIVLKKGDPLGWLITSTNAIFGGAFFPVDVMPPWLEAIARFVPAKYALDALRLTMIQGYSLSMIWKQCLILLIITVFIVPFSVKLFLLAVEKTKKDGTLIQY